MTWQGNDYIIYLDLMGAIDNAKDKKFVVAFDIDWTLIRSKNKHPKTIDDWEFLYEWVPNMLEELSTTHTIVCFSNQTLIHKPDRLEMIKERFLTFATSLEIPIILYVSLGDTSFRKPDLGMVDLFLEQSGKKFDDIIFYVGDAAGRVYTKTKKDFSDSDYRLAKNIDTKLYTPEFYFDGETKGKPTIVGFVPEKKPKSEIRKYRFKYKFPDPVKSPHVIMMMGYPASGKSTFIMKYIDKKSYNVIEFDKTGGKIKMPLDKNGALSKSVVLDGVHMTSSQRDKSFAEIPENVDVYCVYLEMSMEEAMHRDRYRTNKVFYSSDGSVLSHVILQRIPIVAYRIAKKKFVPPTIKEGFTEVIKYYPYIEDELYYRL